jgi:hypothetical protein
MAAPRAARAALIGIVTALALFAAGRDATATPIVFDTLNASLNTGSLAGLTFPVSFSYDAGQIQPVGDSFIDLSSFDFTLLGAPFNRNEIFQGGQVIFHDAILENVTASYQVFLPPNSPVENITFGFGGPGVIGYVDNAHHSGTGSFMFASAAVPEPSTMGLLLLGLCALGAMARSGPFGLTNTPRHTDAKTH